MAFILVLVKYTVSQGAVSQVLKQRSLTTTSSIFASYSNSPRLIHDEVPKQDPLAPSCPRLFFQERAQDQGLPMFDPRGIAACPFPAATSCVKLCCLLLLARCGKRVLHLRALGVSSTRALIKYHVLSPRRLYTWYSHAGCASWMVMNKQAPVISF